jgi:hypothetical protein
MTSNPIVVKARARDRSMTTTIPVRSILPATPPRTNPRGPAGKGFDKSLGVSATDLEALCKDLLVEVAETGKGSP